jgi:hypothetical protein
MIRVLDCTVKEMDSASRARAAVLGGWYAGVLTQEEMVTTSNQPATNFKATPLMQ